MNTQTLARRGFSGLVDAPTPPGSLPGQLVSRERPRDAKTTPPVLAYETRSRSRLRRYVLVVSATIIIGTGIVSELPILIERWNWNPAHPYINPFSSDGQFLWQVCKALWYLVSK